MMMKVFDDVCRLSGLTQEKEREKAPGTLKYREEYINLLLLSLARDLFFILYLSSF